MQKPLQPISAETYSQSQEKLLLQVVNHQGTRTHL